VVQAIENSPEYRIVEVQDQYKSLLHRSPDPVGLKAWTDFLAGGGTNEQLEAQILGSPEFFTRSGGSNATFVAAVYKDVLGRGTDPVGEQVWGQALATGATSRTQVAQGILSSLEGITREVKHLYNRLLYRAPEPEGLSIWVSARMAGGLTREGATAGVAESDEFATLAQTSDSQGGTSIDFPIPNDSNDQLRFYGNYQTFDNGTTLAAEGTTYIGFTPKLGEAFKPLLSINGEVLVAGPNQPDNTIFSFNG
jgi:hypothetical protein